MMENDKLLSMLGMARKAGKTALGADDILSQINKRKCCFVLISEDLSENSKKKIVNACEYNKIEYINTTYSKEKMGKAVGLIEVSAAGFTEKGFAQAAKKLIDR